MRSIQPQPPTLTDAPLTSKQTALDSVTARDLGPIGGPASVSHANDEGGAQLVGGPKAPVSAELLLAAATGLLKEQDTTNGGFGGAPKFPPHMNLLFLLRHHQRTGSSEALEAVRFAAERMGRGGI